MHVLGVVGADAPERATLVEGLVARLADRGAVATVVERSDDPAAPTAPSTPVPGDATTSVHVGPTTRISTGGARSLDAALADLAPDHEYAIVDGYPDARHPKVVLGDGDAADPVLDRAPAADALDIAGLLADLDATEPFETLESLVARAKRAEDAERAGAIATFTGRVRRRDDPDDVATDHLAFEKYDGVADERLATIREDLLARDGVFEVLLHHRTGVVEAGEDIVFVVVLGGHRAEAFRAVEDGIDRLKAEVPIFKKEVTVEDEFWRHERPND